MNRKGRFSRFSRDESMRFIDRKHAFYRIKAMLLSDKLNALIFRENTRFCNRMISNDLQNACFLQIFVPQRAFFCRRGKTKRNFLKIRNSFQRQRKSSFPDPTRQGKGASKRNRGGASPPKNVLGIIYD